MQVCNWMEQGVFDALNKGYLVRPAASDGLPARSPGAPAMPASAHGPHATLAVLQPRDFWYTASMSSHAFAAA